MVRFFTVEGNKDQSYKCYSTKDYETCWTKFTLLKETIVEYDERNKESKPQAEMADY